MNNYDIELSNGDLLVSLPPLEQDGTGNLSTPRAIADVNIAVGTGQVSFTIKDDLTSRFIAGQSFDIVGTTNYVGTYTVAASGSNTTTIGSELYTIIPVNETLPIESFLLSRADATLNAFYVETPSECPFVPTSNVTLSDNTFVGANGEYTITLVESSEPRAITAINVAGNTFSVAGNYVKFYPVGTQASVTSNTTTGNGVYTVVSATFVSGSTVIAVAEDVDSLATASGLIIANPALTIITVDAPIPVGVANDGILSTAPPQAFELTAQSPLVTPVLGGFFDITFYTPGDVSDIFQPYTITGCNILVKNNNVLKFNLVPVRNVAYNSGTDRTAITVRHASSTTPLVNATGVFIVHPLTAAYGYLQYSVPEISSPLRLIGKGSVNYNTNVTWGHALQNNMINMLENFTNDIAPVSPLVGQLWNDTDTPQLRFRDTNSTWQGVVVTQIPVSDYIQMNDQYVYEPNIVYRSGVSGIEFQSGSGGNITFGATAGGSILINGASDLYFNPSSTGGVEFAAGSLGGITIAGTGDILLSNAASTVTLTGGDLFLASTSDIRFTGSGVIDMNSNRINNLGLPSAGTDAANKAYVDGLASGIIWLTPVLDPTLYDDTLTTPPIVNGTEPTTAPQLSVAYHKTYIVPVGATGDWSTLIGRAVQYVFDDVTSSWKWVDILGRAVQINDRFIVFGAPDQGDDLSIAGNLAKGGLTGQTGKIAVVTGVAPYTYAFSTPAEPYAISVTGVSPGSPSPSPTLNHSAYLGYSFTFRGVHGTGTYGANYQWIQFNGPQSLIDGAGLRYVGNILNIGQNTGIIVNTNDIALDEGYTNTVYLRLDGTNTAVNVHTTGQFRSTLATGSPPLVVASTTNVPNLNASSLNGATFASPGPIGSTTPSTGAFTSLAAGIVNSGTWNGSVITGQYGGTGVANTGRTITLGGNLTTAGAFATTITVTGTTSVTLPLTGTLVGSADVDTVTNTMLVNSTISGVELGSNLATLTLGNGLVAGTYNGSAVATAQIDTAVVATLTGVQTLTNKTLTLPVVNTLVDLNTTTASGLTGTVNVDLSTSGQQYYNTDSVANWTFNFRGNAGATLDSILAVGQSITTEIMVQNGATPFYASAHQIDGTPVTPKFAGGVAFVAGNANAVDQYTYKITKTAAATFVVLASLTFFQ